MRDSRRQYVRCTVSSRVRGRSPCSRERLHFRVRPSSSASRARLACRRWNTCSPGECRSQRICSAGRMSGLPKSPNASATARRVPSAPRSAGTWAAPLVGTRAKLAAKRSRRDRSGGTAAAHTEMLRRDGLAPLPTCRGERRARWTTSARQASLENECKPNIAGRSAARHARSTGRSSEMRISAAPFVDGGPASAATPACRPPTGCRSTAAHRCRRTASRTTRRTAGERRCTSPRP